jgi:3-deoxy-7-phosphoheptulonate synthase
MIIVMEEAATERQIDNVIERLTHLNYGVHRSSGARYTVLGAVGDKTVDGRDFNALEGVKEIVPIISPYKLASRAFRPEGTEIRIGDVVIGGPEVIVMAGPCAVESPEQVASVASAVARSGARVLRGGAFKPRTSPYSFQGLGDMGLKYLRQAADRFGLLVVSEIMEASQIPLFLRYVDILQVGARNMQNFNLLRALGQINKPVLLKRGLAATIEETLLAAEYIMSGGNYEVIICERGIRTFETSLRNTLDLAAIPVFKSLSHLPVIVDPSHATGRRDRVVAMAQAAVAAGSDGLLIEVHDCPEAALCDGAQSVLPEQFDGLMCRLRLIAKAVDRFIPDSVYHQPAELKAVAVTANNKIA